MPALEGDTPNQFQGRILNAEPSPFDERDLLFAPDTAAPPPVRFVATGMGPVYNQGNTGTCGAHGGAGIRAWQQKRDHRGVPNIDIFRLYDLVKNVVDKQPDPRRVIGTTIRSVFRLLKGTGTPLKGVSAPGAGGKVETYWRITDADELLMKRALMKHGPLLVRCDWDAGWMRLPFSKILAAPLGRIVGGHIFVIFGWDDRVNGGSWLMRNSWGRWSFLGNGNAYMAFRYFRFKRPEAWASTDIPGN
ncbi:MAG TPA: C1 family peptidase [Candidatus Limnocylindrales bacterium]